MRGQSRERALPAHLLAHVARLRRCSAVAVGTEIRVPKSSSLSRVCGFGSMGSTATTTISSNSSTTDDGDVDARDSLGDLSDLLLVDSEGWRHETRCCCCDVRACDLD